MITIDWLLTECALDLTQHPAEVSYHQVILLSAQGISRWLSGIAAARLI